MKIFVSISAYDAILDASIASILCKKKIANHEVYTCLSYSKGDIDTEIFKKYFDEMNYVDGKEVLDQKILSNYEIPIRQFYSVYLNLKNALIQNFDFMLILNSGSWLFDGEKINEILNRLENYVIGCRAMKYSNLKRLSCDDHLTINLKNFKKTNVSLDEFKICYHLILNMVVYIRY